MPKREELQWSLSVKANTLLLYKTRRQGCLIVTTHQTDVCMCVCAASTTRPNTQRNAKGEICGRPSNLTTKKKVWTFEDESGQVKLTWVRSSIYHESRRVLEITDEVICFGVEAVPSPLQTPFFPSFWYKLISSVFNSSTGFFSCFFGKL